VTKGKPWDFEDEKKLKDWYFSGIKDYGVLSFSFDGKYSKNAIYQKLLDLGLISREEEESEKNASSSTTSCSDLPVGVLTCGDALKMSSEALQGLRTPGLSRSEILRLRGMISGVRMYKDQFADYAHYREIEAELVELKQKYVDLCKKYSEKSTMHES
jgi:hypothetical protein